MCSSDLQGLHDAGPDDAGAGGGPLGAALDDLLTAHPGIADHLVRGASGLTPGLLVPGSAGLLAGLYAPGHGVSTPRDDLAPAGGSRTPTTVADLLDELDEVGALAGEAPGTIEVQTLRGSDGVRHVVYLPGTDDMTTLPWTRDGDVRDMGANLELLAGHPTAYGEGLAQALQQAGVGAGDPVLLVGHSQGGLLAGALAAGGGAGLPGHLVGAVTVGAPLGVTPSLPDGVEVLALENSHDVVPHLDGAPNADQTAMVTVTGDAGGHDAASAHAVGTYGPLAAAVDASGDPSIIGALGAFHGAGFLDPGATASSQIFQIVRTDR